MTVSAFAVAWLSRGAHAGSAGACGANGAAVLFVGECALIGAAELDAAAVHRAAHRACRDAVGDSRVDVASPLDVRRDRRRGGARGSPRDTGNWSGWATAVASAPRTLGGNVRGVRRVPDAAGPTRADAIAIRISRRSSRARCASSARARRSRPAAMAGGSAWCRSRSARCWHPAEELLRIEAAGERDLGPSGARRRRVARVRDRRHPAAAAVTSGSRSAGRSRVRRSPGCIGAFRIAGCSTAAWR